MSTKVRVSIGFAALSAILISCVPSLTGSDSPTQPAGTPASTVPAATAPVTTTPAIQPGAVPANAGSATTPVVTGVTSASAVVVLPAGSFISLQSSLRTQGAIPPSDLSPADLAKLVIEVDGRKLTPDEYKITSAEYNADGEIVLTITFKNPPASPKPLRIASPDGRITLLGTTAKDGSPSRVDVRSTAQSLLQQALKGTVSEADRKAFEDAIAKSIIDLMTSSQVRKLDTDVEMNALLLRIVQQVNSGKPLTKDLLALIITPPHKNNGSGGATNLPTLTAVNPPGQLTGALRNMTLTGTNLSGATAVRWGNVDAAITANTATQINANITFVGPTPRTEAFTVTTPAGTSNGINYNVAE